MVDLPQAYQYRTEGPDLEKPDPPVVVCPINKFVTADSATAPGNVSAYTGTPTGWRSRPRGLYILDWEGAIGKIKGYGINLSKSAELPAEDQVKIQLFDAEASTVLHDSGDIKAQIPIGTGAEGEFDYDVDVEIEPGKLYHVRYMWYVTGSGYTLYSKSPRMALGG